MGRREAVVLAAMVGAMLCGAAFYLRQQEVEAPPSTNTERGSSLSARAHGLRETGRAHDAGVSASSSTSSVSSVHTDDAGAAAAYELVSLDLRCRIDAEASASGKHIRSTTEALCSDLAAEPLSREEVYNAITYAAEHGHVPAQLNYAVYAVRMFEDERNAMDPELIRHYKESTVRFLDAAGRAGESGAYVQLSDIYRNGVLAAEDPVLSYAYAEAYFRTGTSRYGAAFVRMASEPLDDAQRRRGRDIADRIVGSRQERSDASR